MILASKVRACKNEKKISDLEILWISSSLERRALSMNGRMKHEFFKYFNPFDAFAARDKLLEWAIGY